MTKKSGGSKRGGGGSRMGTSRVDLGSAVATWMQSAGFRGDVAAVSTAFVEIPASSARIEGDVTEALLGADPEDARAVLQSVEELIVEYRLIASNAAAALAALRDFHDQVEQREFE